MIAKGIFKSLLLLLFLSLSLAAQDASRSNVLFESRDITLSGELVLPKNTSNVPVILFLVGSGENSSHRLIYQSFTQEILEKVFIPEGYGIFYYDKRGIGESKGKWWRSTMFDRADDTKAAIDYLKTIDKVNPDRIAVVGHSEGGVIAQLMGALYPNDVKAVVSLAASVSNTQKTLQNIYHAQFICDDEPEKIAMEKSEKKSISDINWVDWFPFRKSWRHLKYNADFDPTVELKNLNIPTLFVFAENDNMVYPNWSINHLNDIFFGNIPANMDIETVKGANHDFKVAGMCADEETINSAPYADFVKRLLKNWLFENL